MPDKYLDAEITGECRIDYKEIPETVVLGFFMGGCILAEGEELLGWRAYYDPNKNMFIFRLTIKENSVTENENTNL